MLVLLNSHGQMMIVELKEVGGAQAARSLGLEAGKELKLLGLERKRKSWGNNFSIIITKCEGHAT